MTLRNSLLALLTCSASVVLTAQPTTFNDPLTNFSAGNWSSAVPSGAPPAGGGSLTFTTAGLRYIVNTPTPMDVGYRTLISTVAPSTLDWDARVNVNLNAFTTATLTVNQWVNLNFFIGHVNSSGQFVGTNHDANFAIDRFNEAGTITRGLEIYMPAFGETPLYSVPGGMTAVTLRIAYNASAAALSYYFDPDGATNGFAFTSVGLPVSISSWSMAPTDNFAFLLIGGSGHDGLGSEVGPSLDGSGSFFTDFSLVVVPEPGTCVLAAGLAALGLAAWQRRRKAAR